MPLKGLILSGGKGTRLRPITHTSAKQLVPVANKPVLFYGIEAMAARGHRARSGSSSPPRRATRSARPPATARAFGVEITYIVQDEPAGLAHAVLTAEPFLGDAPVRHVPRRQPAAGRHRRTSSRRSEANEPDALILLTPVPDPEHYGVAELDGDRVVALAEKPPEPKTEPRARRRLHVHAGRSTTRRARSSRRARGELEITDAIQHLVDTGRARRAAHRAGLVEGHRPPGGHARGQPADPRHASSTRVEGELIDSQVEGRVVIEAGARLERATVRGPAIIGAGARLTDCYIGPYTAIGEGCVDRARRGRALDPARRLRRCATSTGAWSPRCWAATCTIAPRRAASPRAYRFMVGDNSEIGIL